MTTVKELIELLKPFAKNDATISNHEMAQFVHISNLTVLVYEK